MKNKSMVIICSLLLAVPVSGFAEEKVVPDPGVSAYEQANDNARFRRERYVFNSKEKRALRAKWKAEKDAVKAEKTMDEAQDKGEGQFKFRF